MVRMETPETSPIWESELREPLESYLWQFWTSCLLVALDDSEHCPILIVTLFFLQIPHDYCLEQSGNLVRIEHIHEGQQAVLKSSRYRIGRESTKRCGECLGQLRET